MAPVFSAPRDAHPGDTSQIRHVYPNWSLQPHRGVGDAPGSVSVVRNKKAVTTALGRNPSARTKGESMCNGFHLSLPTATVWILPPLFGAVNTIVTLIGAIAQPQVVTVIGAIGLSPP